MSIATLNMENNLVISKAAEEVFLIGLNKNLINTCKAVLRFYGNANGAHDPVGYTAYVMSEVRSRLTKAGLSD